jgi:hypothetical protein
MSYCRFSNTLQDLIDCQEHLDDPDYDEKGQSEDEEPNMLSEAETEARKELIKLCQEIAEDYGDL